MIKRETVVALRAEAEANLQEMIGWRRQIHARPELAFEEKETSRLICEVLDSLRIPYESGVGETGIVATIHASNPRKTIALRADMDGLPLQEEAEFPFRSSIDGLMHGCGHDAHVAILLGVAKLLAGLDEKLTADIVFLFQPAEEIGAGAERMAASGRIPSLDLLIAGHVGLGDLPLGNIGLRAGPIMASGDFFRARFEGSGGHGAHPEEAVNPIPPCLHWSHAAMELLGLELASTERSVLSLTHLNAGTNANVIPASAFVEGSFRTFSREAQAHMLRRLEDMTKHYAKAGKTRGHFDITRSFPLTVNSPQGIQKARDILELLVGRECLVAPSPIMGSEDVSNLSDAPLIYLFLGSRPSCISYPNHHPKFSIDEQVLAIGAAAQACLAVGLVD